MINYLLVSKKKKKNGTFSHRCASLLSQREVFVIILYKILRTLSVDSRESNRQSVSSVTRSVPLERMLQDLATESKNKLTLYLVKQRSIKDGTFVIITKQGESKTVPRCQANFIFILSIFFVIGDRYFHHSLFINFSLCWCHCNIVILLVVILQKKWKILGLDLFKKNTWRGWEPLPTNNRLTMLEYVSRFLKLKIKHGMEEYHRLIDIFKEKYIYIPFFFFILRLV